MEWRVSLVQDKKLCKVTVSAGGMAVFPKNKSNNEDEQVQYETSFEIQFDHLDLWLCHTDYTVAKAVKAKE